MDKLRNAALSRAEHTGEGCFARTAQAENNHPLEQAALHSGTDAHGQGQVAGLQATAVAQR